MIKNKRLVSGYINPLNMLLMYLQIHVKHKYILIYPSSFLVNGHSIYTCNTDLSVSIIF